jgi:hypothetical protein
MTRAISPIKGYGSKSIGSNTLVWTAIFKELMSGTPLHVAAARAGLAMTKWVVREFAKQMTMRYMQAVLMAMQRAPSKSRMVGPCPNTWGGSLPKWCATSLGGISASIMMGRSCSMGAASERPWTSSSHSAQS